MKRKLSLTVCVLETYADIYIYIGLYKFRLIDNMSSFFVLQELIDKKKERLGVFLDVTI